MRLAIILDLGSEPVKEDAMDLATEVVSPVYRALVDEAAILVPATREVVGREPWP